MKLSKSTIALLLALLAGLSLLLYPAVSDWWNSFHQSRAIAGYVSATSNMDEADYADMLAQARSYNADLLGFANRYYPTDYEHQRYIDTLNVTPDGIMCYVEIPSIRLSLPVYHGVDDAVLQVAIGHIEGTSLPVGGPSTHCVISGHRGLPSAELFSNIDQLREGDTFMLQVLGDTLTYEVDQIRIVLPDELDDIDIVENQDLCTLVTCTPYGVNTHRLLVRGHRVANDPDDPRVVADARQIDPAYVAPFVAAPIIAAMIIAVVVHDRRRARRPKRAHSAPASHGGPQRAGAGAASAPRHAKDQTGAPAPSTSDDYVPLHRKKGTDE